MKVCTRCGEINNDTNLICINCNASNKFFIDYDEATLISEKNIAKKSKMKRNIFLNLSIISILFIGLLLFLNFINQTLSFDLIFRIVLLVAIGIVLIKFTGKIFLLTHIFLLKDLDEDQMSDMYDSYIKLIGFILIFWAIVNMIKPLIK